METDQTKRASVPVEDELALAAGGGLSGAPGQGLDQAVEAIAPDDGSELGALDNGHAHPLDDQVEDPEAARSGA
jgi:hypothetical protein